MSTQTVEDLDLVALLGRPVHTLCCDDHDTALCGHDVSNRPYKPRGTAITCAPCIENIDARFCAKTGRHCEWLEFQDHDDEE